MMVEFLEGRDFMTAWVLSPASHRLTVLGLNGREMTVSQARVINSVDLPDPGDKSGRLELLRAVDATRRALAAGVDLGELWAVLEGEGQQFSYSSLASLYFGGSPSADEISALSRSVFGDGLRFRFSPAGAVRHSAEDVQRLEEIRHQEAEAERSLEAMAQWLRSAAAGRAAPEPPERARAVELLKDLALWGDKAARRQEAKNLMERAGLAPDEDAAFKALFSLGEFTRHENLDLRRLGIPLNFGPEAGRSVAALIAGSAVRRSDRLDLTGHKTMTIDSNGARDLDDAVSIKSLAGGRYQVGLHITDVAAFVTPGSALDSEARARAASIYLPDAKYPMLPAELSEGLLSLAPGEIKPALSFVATLEKDGRISDYALSPSLIRVDRQLSFSEADQNLDEDSDLVDLWDLAQTLTARRVAQGGLNLNIPKLNVYFLPDSSLMVGVTQWDTPAKTIIGELMILANYLAADLLRQHGYACPYRYQDKPRGSGPERLAPGSEADIPGDDLNLARSLAARRRTGRSGLSFSPAPHHGLGLPVYTAFTAPMRRYIDLLVARQLRAVAEGRPAMSQQEFLKLALPSHELAQSIQKMQNLRQRYWLKKYLSDRIGHNFSALVFDQHDRRLRVCVTDYMQEVDLYLPKGEGGSRPPDLFGRRLTVKLAALPPAAGEPPRFEVVL
ncbi:MAG: RNB domain-containing ribonuclease [Candidatus Adiutrix sp.]|jgi:exoribonuclease-2|nr:RNB domain-containing ribonuclease [Candidatus Adiutrix sp.]